MRIRASLSTALLAAAFLLFSSGTAQAVTMITFDALGHGDVVTSNSGVTFNVTNNGGGPNRAVVFDTEQASDPNDGDLLRFGTGPQDNPGSWKAGNLAPNTVLNKALIVQENDTGCATGTCSNPDDEAGGGVIEMVLATPVFSVGIDVIDIDDNEGGGGLTFWDGAVSVFFSWTSLLGAANLDNNSANRIAPISIQNVDLAAAGFDGIDKLEVTFLASGAIDNVLLDEEFPPAPEPGSAALLGLGLAGLAFASRRPRQS